MFSIKTLGRTLISAAVLLTIVLTTLPADAQLFSYTQASGPFGTYYYQNEGNNTVSIINGRYGSISNVGQSVGYSFGSNSESNECYVYPLPEASLYVQQPNGTKELKRRVRINYGGAHRVNVRLTPEEMENVFIETNAHQSAYALRPNGTWAEFDPYNTAPHGYSYERGHGRDWSPSNRPIQNMPIETTQIGIEGNRGTYLAEGEPGNKGCILGNVDMHLTEQATYRVVVGTTGPSGSNAITQNIYETRYRDSARFRILFNLIPDIPRPTCSLTATAPYYRGGNAFTRLVWSTSDSDSASITRNGTEIGTGRNNSGREVRLIGEGANTFRLRAENSEGSCTVTRVVSPAQCADNRDNDSDGFTDEDDQGCWTDPNNPNTYDPSDPGEWNPNYCPDGVAGDVRGRSFSGGAFRQEVSLTLGEELQLRTTSNGCTRFSNLQGPGINGSITIGSASPFGTGPITPPNRVGTYTYTYTLQDPRGNRATDTIAVNVVAPVPTAEIDASADVVNPGDTYRVNWSTTNAASVRVFKDGAELSTAASGVSNQTARAAEVGMTLTYRVIATQLGDGDPVEDTDTVRVLTECADGRDSDGDGQNDRNDPGCWTDPEDPTTYDPDDNTEDTEGGTDPAVLDVAPDVSITANGVADRTTVRADRDFTVEWNPNGYTTPSSPAANSAGIRCELAPAAIFADAGVTADEMMRAGSVTLRRTALTTFSYTCTSPDAVGQKAWQGGADSSAEVNVEVTPQVFDS